MNKISRSLIASVVAILFIPVVALADGNGTEVRRYVDIPFGYFQCVPMNDPFPDIPLYFSQNFGISVDGEGVCLQYDATWSQTLRMKRNGDVAWTTSTVGTVAFFDNTFGGLETPEDVIGVTPIIVAQYKGDEVGRDLDGDADCLLPDDPDEWGDIAGAAVAEMTSCWLNWETKLDFLEMHQKIEFEGETIVYWRVAIHGLGDICTSSKSVGWGPDCPPGISTEG